MNVLIPFGAIFTPFEAKNRMWFPSTNPVPFLFFSGVRLCMQREFKMTNLLNSDWSTMSYLSLQLLFSSDQMALSFHIPFLFYDEWGVRHMMFSRVSIQERWTQGFKLTVAKMILSVIPHILHDLFVTRDLFLIVTKIEKPSCMTRYIEI